MKQTFNPYSINDNQNSSIDFQQIRMKRIPTELHMIEQRQDFQNYIIQNYKSSLNLTLNVQIPISEVASSINDQSAYFQYFEKDNLDKFEEQKREIQQNEKKQENPGNIEPIENHFMFEILLDNKYPFSQPYITCHTKFTSIIDLYDGKDLYTDILNGEDWKVARNLHEIIAAFPSFINRMQQLDNEQIENKEIQDAKNFQQNSSNITILTQVIGRYHLEIFYEMKHFMKGNFYPGKYSKTCKFYKGLEQDEIIQGQPVTYSQKYIIVTKTCFLIFSPEKNNAYIGLLEFWATLQSLERIRRNLNNPNIVTIQWRTTEKLNQKQQLSILQIGEQKQHIEEFLEHLVRQMQEIGMGHRKKVQKIHKIDESEVSVGSVAKLDIKNLMFNIENYEEAVRQGDFDLDTIRTLTALYPKAIEYFSAFDNNMFNDLLNRMQSLLQREDVQILLNSINHKETDQNKNSENTEERVKFDFNVSQEDVEKHRKKMQEESQELKNVNELQKKKEEIKIDGQNVMFAIGDDSD